MKKLVSLVVVGAMLLAACGSGGGVAATVDDTDVTVDDVEALIASDAATVPVEEFAQYLAAAIQFNIFFDAAEADFGVTATEEEIEAEAQRLYEELATEGETREDFLSTRGVTEDFLAKIAEQSVVDTAIRDSMVADAAEPTQEEIDAEREIAMSALTSACVSHVLVETEAEADDVMTRLDDGEDFGEIATEVSTDTGSAANAGALPCGSPDGYVEPFRDAVLDATIGEVYPEPVESQFGFHVILVTELTEPTEADLPTDEELAENIREASVAAEVQEWFNGIMEAAEVTVNEEYGTWQSSPPAVIPPSQSSTSTTLGSPDTTEGSPDTTVGSTSTTTGE
jgi:foldase protein PrsA